MVENADTNMHNHVNGGVLLKVFIRVVVQSLCHKWLSYSLKVTLVNHDLSDINFDVEKKLQ